MTASTDPSGSLVVSEAGRLQRLLGPFGLMVCGVVFGLGFVIAAGVVGPFKAFAALIGIGVAAAVIMNPEWGFVLMIAAIPLERVGRLTSADAVVALSISKVFGVLTLVGWLLRLCIRREPVIVTRDFFLLSLFGLAGAFSLTYSTDLTMTEIAVSRYVTTLAFVFIVVNLIRSPEVIRATLIGFLAATALVGILAVAMRVAPTFVITDAEVDDIGILTDAAEEDRVGNIASSQGLTTHPGFYVCSLLIALPLYLYFYQTARSRRWSLLAAAAGCLALVNLFLTHRRAGVLVLAFLLVVTLKKRLATISPMMFLVLGLFGLGFMFVLPDSVWERIFSLSAYDPEASNNVGARLDMWKGAVLLIREHWLFGVGMGNHSELRNYNDLYRILTESGAHNGYLQMMMELGLVGMVIFLSMLWMLWNNFSRAEQAPSNRVALSPELHRLTGYLKIAFLAPVLLAIGGIEFTQPLRDWWLVCGLGMVLRRWTEQPLPGEKRDTLLQEKS